MAKNPNANKQINIVVKIDKPIKWHRDDNGQNRGNVYGFSVSIYSPKYEHLSNNSVRKLCSDMNSFLMRC